MKILNNTKRGFGSGKKYSSKATQVWGGKIIHSLDFENLEIISDGRIGM
jgi:hypothetical protein